MSGHIEGDWRAGGPERTRERHKARDRPAAYVKHLTIAGLCLVSVLVAGMALAGSAFAGPLWLVCLEGSGLTKYTSNQCAIVSETGNWQSLGLPAGKTDTVRLVAFSLRLTDLKAGLLKEKSSVKCNGKGSKGFGVIEASGKGKITVAEIEEPKTNCERLEGPCKAGEVEKVVGVNLPWKTEPFVEKGKISNKILAGTAGKEPGWKVTCNTTFGSKTDECLSESEAKAETAELVNEVTAGVLLVRAILQKAHKAKCSEGGAETGEVEGLLAILLNNGNGLSINAGNEPGTAPTPKEKLGPENPGSPKLVQSCAGKPVNCATGNETESQTDVSIGGRGPGLRVVRSYNSLAAAEATEAGPWGFGWTGPYSARLELNTQAETVTVFQANGSDVVFYTIGEAYVPASWVEARLVKESSNYIYTLPDQSKLEFNSEGKLVKETDRNGNSNALTYKEGKLEKVTDGDSRTLTFKYNGEGLVESVKDPLGHTVSYTYSSKNLASVTIEGKVRWKFEYESPHLLTKVTDGREHSTTLKYDASHRVTEETQAGHTRKWEYKTNETKITEPNGSETLETFNSAGEPTKVTRAKGVSGVETTTEYEYNAATFARTKTIDGNKHETTYGYDEEGNKTSEKDPNGDEKKWEYDKKHDVIKETTPEGETTTIKRTSTGEPEVVERPIGSETQKTEYQYTEKGVLTGVVDPLKHTTKYTYDAAGDREVETDPEGNERKWKYNEDSQETEETSPRGFTTKTERDEQGRPIKITDPLTHTTKYKYDGNGNIESETDGNSHTTTYVYNEENLRTKVEEANGNHPETEYDSEGKMTVHTDGNGHKWEYKRNQLEEVTEEVNPLTKVTKKKYDKAGSLESSEDPEKHTTEYKYDESNRLKSISYSTGKPSEVTYEYNNDSKVKKMTDGTGTTTNTYDKLDRLTESENGAKKVVKYEYNLANEPTKITYPNKEAVTRAYDKDNRLEKVTDWKTKVTKFSYNADSQLSATVFPAETSNEDKYAYNEADQMTEVEMNGTEKLGKLVYERDGDGQVKKTTTTTLPGPASSEDLYDASNRLTESNKLAYEYDKANNPTKLEGTGTYAYNAADQLEKGPEFTYAYNEDGRRTETKPTKGPATTYGYDQVGNLTSVERPESTEKPKIEDTFTYDGNNLRASQTLNGAKTNLTWDTAEGLPLILEDETNSYIYGPEGLPVEQISSGGTTLYFHHDQQGSTRLLSGSTGKTEAAYTYNPYGSINASTGSATTPLRYDGQYTNTDTGLIYLRARTYDPATAQFLSVDPALATTGEPYVYTRGNPLNETDPGGECAQPDRCRQLRANALRSLEGARGAAELAAWGWAQAARIQEEISAVPFYDVQRWAELNSAFREAVRNAENASASSMRQDNASFRYMMEYLRDCLNP